ncbi:hypothetical protein QR680_007862 [Steinernema hermaphroditum]|uniref:Olfactomedin-like domain-containing protein n=1 Tax=Steinernema hermaphroditum TaxID=289476 RepID=A0AA39M6M1_9BILA|nr:hypothetical protein QR680_007862 [Steinernema hermaphroditum]
MHLARRLRILSAVQTINFVVLLLAYIHAWLRTQAPQCNPIRIKRDADPDPYLHAPYLPEDLDQWTVLVGHDTIIPKNVFEKSCRRVHRYCAERGKKLQGFQGNPGPAGPKGPIGPPGRRGTQGRIGPVGLVGEHGEIGDPGIDGRCNCSFPDMYVHRVEVPGPPVIQIQEKVVPVPVVVVKEVEVTKLVPFEPTPPGFGPPPGWSPGMPRPDLSKTVIIPRYTTVTTTPRPTEEPTLAAPVGPPREEATEEYGNATTTEGTTPEPTTTEPYTGLPTLGQNRRECQLNAVGIPVLHAESQYGEVGSWMRDASPYSDEMAERRWVTDDYASPVLYEYKNERQLMNKKQKIKYYVDYLASGTGNMVYNGSYFYHRHGSNFLVRYDLETTDQFQLDSIGDMASIDCDRKPDHTFESCNETERDPWLYNRPHNYIDYAVDENGLWLIYMKSDSPHLFVSKLETDFYVVDTWELTDVNGTELADAFVMCGILYGLRSGKERDTRIDYAFNLYTNETLDVDIRWYNPYRGLTMLHYNPIDGRLYFFDTRKLLSVNVRMESDVVSVKNG